MATGSPAVRWLLVGLVALGTAVAGAYLRQRTSAPAADPVAAALAPAPKPGPLATVPALRPLFTLKDPQGTPHAISEWDGRPLMVNFWATWCAPCRREIPLLNRLYHEPALPDLAIVGIAVDVPADVVSFLREVPVDYPVRVGEQDGLDAANAFGVEQMAFPFTAFVDRQGRVFSVHLGELHEADARATLALLADVDAGRLSPAAARAELTRRLAAPAAAAASPHS